MALTDTQKAYLAEIIGCHDPDQFSSELLNLTASQETLLTANIDEWVEIRNEDASISGGRAGIQFSYGAARKRIRRRVLDMLDAWYLADDSAMGGGGGGSGISLVRA